MRIVHIFAIIQKITKYGKETAGAYGKAGDFKPPFGKNAGDHSVFGGALRLRTDLWGRPVRNVVYAISKCSVPKFTLLLNGKHHNALLKVM